MHPPPARDTVVTAGGGDRVSVQDGTPWLPDLVVAYTEIWALCLQAGEGLQLPAVMGGCTPDATAAPNAMAAQFSSSNCFFPTHAHLHVEHPWHGSPRGPGQNGGP